MTIEQTIEVPASHRITLEIPPQIPVGTTRLVIQFPFKEDTQTATVPQEVKGQLNNEAFRQALRRAHGAWKDNPWMNHLSDVNSMRNENDHPNSPE